MQYLDSQLLKTLIIPKRWSHKGKNGKMAIIGGSKLFHGASLFALKMASRVADMVHYISVPENQVLTEYLKRNLYAFIVVPRGKEDEYLSEDDAILIGPGMVRGSDLYTGTSESGQQTRETTLLYFRKFPKKQWIVDAGALQTLQSKDLLQLENPIITPHKQEFINLFSKLSEKDMDLVQKGDKDEKQWLELGKIVQAKAKLINGVIVLKGEVDIIADKDNLFFNKTGNAGMTKGGTGDVLAGLITALACINKPIVAATVGAYINGLTGDSLYQKVGPYFGGDDLANYVPEILWLQLQKSGRKDLNLSEK